MQAVAKSSLLIACMLLLATACGGGEPQANDAPSVESNATDAAAMPAEGAATSNSEAGAAECEDTLAAVQAELDGLAGEERHQRLVELAQDDAVLSFYTSNSDAVGLSEGFSDQYDIEVEVFRALANQVLSRLVEENAAGFHGADVVDLNFEEMVVLDQVEGLLTPYDGPALDGLPESVQFPGWTGNRLDIFVTAQNTAALPESERPQSYRDLADPKYAGMMMMDPRDDGWFATLWQHFLEQGMSEEEVDGLFTAMAENSTLVPGHATQMELLAAGEYAISVSNYPHLVDGLIASGAPLTWKPALSPTIMRPNGAGVLCSAPHPAAALLFHEWLLTDAQELIAGFDRIPALPDARSGGAAEQIDFLTIDVATVFDSEKWVDLYEGILRNAQQGPG